ncbi:MAG: 2-hydroxyacyl-CoA dehydratase [Oscillospiraceae bacterium]|nr:2-hydroxyacyl-CoA dehydratase [Oscillospiraceae bacterium]
MDNKLNLPADFESYPQARKAGFMRMKELKEKGAKVVGLFCSFVPLELVYAAGALPIGLCAFTDEPIPAAEANLPRNLCPLIKASYGFALTDTCPYFYFSDIIIGETTCDGKKKMFELLNEIKETYVMQLPHSRDAASLEFWKGQIIAFQKKLEDFYGITITEEDIRKAIRQKNRERKVMKAYLELGKLDPAPMSGYEMGTRVDAGSFSFDLDQRCDVIEKRTAEVIADWEANKKGKPSNRPRLLVTGCPNAGVREKIIRAVEELGADIVAFDTCNGIRDKVELVDESNPDVYEALAKKYLNINCSVMSPNNSRLEYMAQMIDDYHIDGVIEIVLQSCHTYDVEAFFVKRLVTEQKGKAYLNIETDYSQSDKGQINTRLAAFLETIDR